ncbi:hypothetical protein TEA_015844 [Camellia sinensis var. sinensis]|uniref:Glucosidase II beta subunit N-terminal domain-containing protein n=1 Tax=Camellia sinensis var. sinensis TaxID=542762 RepID=A0A4S4DW73_CAMSN|nr:hypothetical protein TEA_015844 [Camellia sinensis var. sinensis]
MKTSSFSSSSSSFSLLWFIIMLWVAFFIGRSASVPSRDLLGIAPQGTSACPNGKFYCHNAGYAPFFIFSSRVNDGICDCCDGSDEYDGKVKCSNTCWEAGKVARDKLKKKIATYQEGVTLRKQEVEQAKLAVAKDEAELSKLTSEEKILKGLVQQLKVETKEVVEELGREVYPNEERNNREYALDPYIGTCGRERKEQIEKAEEKERLQKEKEEKEKKAAEEAKGEKSKAVEETSSQVNPEESTNPDNTGLLEDSSSDQVRLVLERKEQIEKAEEKERLQKEKEEKEKKAAEEAKGEKSKAVEETSSQGNPEESTNPDNTGLLEDSSSDQDAREHPNDFIDEIAHSDNSGNEGLPKNEVQEGEAKEEEESPVAYESDPGVVSKAGRGNTWIRMHLQLVLMQL